MEINYLIILDYSCGELIKIKLTDDEKRQSEEHDVYVHLGRKVRFQSI